MKNVTGKQIAFELSLCGISSGDVVLMHSSLSSIGHVEGGADTVIDAMLDVIGPSGTFAVSTLSNNGEPFDPDNTPSGVGRVSEALRKRHGAIRSLHPIHSIAAIGARATELCGGHDKCASGC
ncbi:MAG: AAC(3) family N-acetyltransferase, partial [Clostridia bacterium]